MDRLAEHTQALRTLNPAYATVRHTMEQHAGLLPAYTFHYHSSHMSSTERQIKESIKIEDYECDFILNSKGEWGTNLVPRPRFDEATPGNSESNTCWQQSENVNNRKKWKLVTDPNIEATKLVEAGNRRLNSGNKAKADQNLLNVSGNGISELETVSANKKDIVSVNNAVHIKNKMRRKYSNSS